MGIETENFISGLSRQEGQSVLDFFQQALLFSTWYIASKDQSELDSMKYMMQAMPVVGRTDREIPVPDQTHFKLAVEVANSFINGYVNTDDLQKLKIAGEKVKEDLAPVVVSIFEGNGGYKMKSNGIGCPKVVSDSFYPLTLADFIGLNINEEGLVVGVSPACRNLLGAMCSDEMSCLARIQDQPRP